MGGKRKSKENYIPISGRLNRSQKSSAKEAIIWLLSKSRHTEVGIAEHFGLPVSIVAELVNDMEKTGRIIREKGATKYIFLKNKLMLD